MGRKRNDEKIQVVNIRMVKEPSIYSEDRITCPEDAVKVIAKDLATYDREVFAVLNLKTNGQPINFNICSVGILSNAASMLVFHTHPSGNLEPSQEDKEVTRRLIAAADLMGLSLLDHVIIGGGTDKVFSFRQAGMMEQLKPRYREWER